MKQLAIDTSSPTATIALRCGDEILMNQQEEVRTHAQSILPHIDALLAQAQIAMTDLDSIIFGCGPGSFTGLRIACSVAKALAYACDVGVIPISSLKTIAHKARVQCNDMSAPVLSLIDARMQEVYWSFDDSSEDAALEHVSAVTDIIMPTDKPFVMAGFKESFDFVPVQFQEKCIERLSLSADAATMISLVAHCQLQPILPQDAKPTYIRNTVVHGGQRG